MYRRPRNRGVATAVVPTLLLAGVGIGAYVASSPSTPVSLTAADTITVTGHGHGHGRGMGQWGAFGYAKRGWLADQILAHYYGGTSAGKVDNSPIQVTLTEQSSANVYADAGMKVGNETVAPGQAVSLSGTTATIRSGCGGGPVRTVTVSPPSINPINPGPNRPANEWLKFCGSNAAYRGSVALDGGAVVNVLGVDDYTKGVTPKESPANWADEGAAEALKAQAVAARTYALAAIASGKKIDDTMGSQVYGGAGNEDPRTNAAADATAGQVRLTGGKPAFTEFSSSTGGYSAGGNFPAVIDDGDSASPTHDWTATIGSASIASAFGVGSLLDFSVIEANGLGAENGRALKVRISGSNGTVEATGEEVRAKLQLKSAWFSVAGQPRPRIVAPPGGVGPSTPGTPSLPGAPASGAAGNIPAVIDGVSKLLNAGSSGGASSSSLVGPVTTAVTDAINAKITELGGNSGMLGKALSPVIPLIGGFVQKFANGNVYFSHSAGAHALVGNALRTFVDGGAERTQGFPTADAISRT